MATERLACGRRRAKDGIASGNLRRFEECQPPEVPIDFLRLFAFQKASGAHTLRMEIMVDLILAGCLQLGASDRPPKAWLKYYKQTYFLALCVRGRKDSSARGAWKFLNEDRPSTADLLRLGINRGHLALSVK